MRTDTCFFCGGDISGKISREHIFGNSFLAYMGLKQGNASSSQPRATAYSKIKVPSHRECNNREGSWFESYVLSIIRSMDKNLDHLEGLHTSTGEGINEGLREAFTQWLAKLYFGLIYWEAGLTKHANPSYQQWLGQILDEPEFAYLRRCFAEDLGFRLPSSLFYFSVPDAPDPIFRFDFATGLPHGLFYIRFNKHLLVTALGDGRMVHEWFRDEHVTMCQAHLTEQARIDPVAYLGPVSHIWAVRESLPAEPRLEYYETRILDRSRDDFKVPPEIDSETVNVRAKEIFDEQASRWKRSHRS